MRARLAGIVGTAALLCCAPAQSAVYSGSASDPAGDLPVGFTNVAVKYDDVAGRVDVSFTFGRPVASDQTVSGEVGLGSIQPGGTCSAPPFERVPISAQGETVVVGRSRGFTGSVSGRVWNWYPEESWGGAALFEWPGSEKKAWNFATRHPVLIGRLYTCATAAVHVAGAGVDQLDRGTIQLKPTAAASSSAKWLSPADGQTVSGLLTEVEVGARHCEAKIVGPVARTENYVDGKLNDTQLYHPWGCVWDTRKYVNGGHLLTVKAYNAANAVIAANTVRVTVDNPSPPPVNSPPSLPEAEVPTGPSGSQKRNPALRFTARRARAAVKRALARRYGKAFRKRKGYTAECAKLSSKRWSCAVRWRYGQFVFKGKVKLSLRFDGHIKSRAVLRTLID